MARPNNAAAIGGYIQGLREAKAQFQRLPEVVRDHLNGATEISVKAIARQAQATIQASPSIDTRALYDHIGWAMNWKAGRGSAGVRRATTSYRSYSGARLRRVKGLVRASARAKKGYVVDQPASRAHFVEFGTPKMRAEPFMIPAAEAQKGPYLERAMRAGKGIERDMSTVGGGRL